MDGIDGNGESRTICFWGHHFGMQSWWYNNFFFIQGMKILLLPTTSQEIMRICEIIFLPCSSVADETLLIEQLISVRVEMWMIATRRRKNDYCVLLSTMKTKNMGRGGMKCPCPHLISCPLPPLNQHIIALKFWGRIWHRDSRMNNLRNSLLSID